MKNNSDTGFFSHLLSIYNLQSPFGGFCDWILRASFLANWHRGFRTRVLGSPPPSMFWVTSGRLWSIPHLEAFIYGIEMMIIKPTS